MRPNFHFRFTDVCVCWLLWKSHRKFQNMYTNCFCREFIWAFKSLIAVCLGSILIAVLQLMLPHPKKDKKLSYCWETVRRESMPRIAEMDVEMTT